MGGGLQELDLDAPYTFVANVQLGLHLGPLTSGVEVVSVSVSCLWSPFP